MLRWGSLPCGKHSTLISPAKVQLLFELTKQKIKYL